jgi:hypothetical protein
VKETLKHAQVILETYRGRAAAAVTIIGVLAVAMIHAHFETVPVRSTLLLLEWLCAFVGIYSAVTLRTQLLAQISHVVPGYTRKHVAAAFGMVLVIVGACVAGSSLTGTGELWASASYVNMFALLWGWSLAWFGVGYVYARGIAPILLHLPVLSVLAARMEPVLWSFVGRPSSFEGVILLAAVAGFNGLLAFLVARAAHDGLAKVDFNYGSPAKLFRKAPELVGQGLHSRIRHLELGLRPDYWIAGLAIATAIFTWLRGGPFGSEKIYVWFFMWSFFMGGPDVLRRDRLSPLFRLPLSRLDLVRSYGLTLLAACLRRWLWFVLVAHAAILVRLAKADAPPPTLEVWIYCLAILFTVFGVRALLGSWDEWLPLRVAAFAILVLYGTFSDVLPFVTPVTTLCVGLALIGTAYYRWCNLELG